MSTSFEDGLSTIIDSTTRASYTYIYKAMSPTAAITDAVWICKRIVVASGTSRFADGVSDFSDASLLMTVAEGLSATYTAG